jgi:hypothetical protein
MLKMDLNIPDKIQIPELPHSITVSYLFLLPFPYMQPCSHDLPPINPLETGKWTVDCEDVPSWQMARSIHNSHTLANPITHGQIVWPIRITGDVRTADDFVSTNVDNWSLWLWRYIVNPHKCSEPLFHCPSCAIYIWDSVLFDRLCGLVVRVLGYRSGGPGSIPGTTRKKK